MSSRIPKAKSSKKIQPLKRKTTKTTRGTIKPGTSTSKMPTTKNIKINPNEAIFRENTQLKSNFNKVNLELDKTRKSNAALERQNNTLLAQIAKLEKQQKVVIEKDLPSRITEIDNLKRNLQLVQKQKKDLENKNAIAEKRIKDLTDRVADLELQVKKKGATPTVQPIAKTEFTNIFKEIIENFNQQPVGGPNAKMDYIISDMDVELKTQVSYDSKGKMTLGTPNIGDIEKAKDSLSVMKFKIRPVPKKSANIQ